MIRYSFLCHLSTKLHLLSDLYGGVFISAGAYHEVVRRGRGRAGAQAAIDADFIHVEYVVEKRCIEQYTDRLSREDAELIVLAKEQNANLILTRDRGLQRC